MFPWSSYASFLLHSVLSSLVSCPTALFKVGAFEAFEFLEHGEGVGAGELDIPLVVPSPIFACLFLVDTIANRLLV